MGSAYWYVSSHSSSANKIPRTLQKWAQVKISNDQSQPFVQFVALDTCNSHAPATDFHLNPSGLPSARAYFRFREREKERENLDEEISLAAMDGGKRRVDSRCVAAPDGKVNMVIDEIMLRFRPIAPRPVTVESSGGAFQTKDGILNSKRVKRKYVRVKKKNNNNKTTAGCSLSINDDRNLFDMAGTELGVTDPLQKVTNWISFDLPGNSRKGIVSDLIIPEPAEKLSSDLHGVDLASAVERRKVVESWITMESVTGTCEDRRLLGYTDDEIWKNLDSDSCPGFISNSYDEVLWVNPAYRRMLDLNPDGGTPATDVAVWLVMKVEKSTVVKYLPAFSCKVRIEYRLSEKKTQMMVPCDVCAMDSGDFAWRLDVKFALSLGPLN